MSAEKDVALGGDPHRCRAFGCVALHELGTRTRNRACWGTRSGDRKRARHGPFPGPNDAVLGAAPPPARSNALLGAAEPSSPLSASAASTREGEAAGGPAPARFSAPCAGRTCRRSSSTVTSSCATARSRHSMRPTSADAPANVHSNDPLSARRITSRTSARAGDVCGGRGVYEAEPLQPSGVVRLRFPPATAGAPRGCGRCRATGGAARRRRLRRGRRRRRTAAR